MTARHRVFARMWGVAVIAHLAGNWRYGDVWPHPTLVGVLLAVAGLLATATIVSPRRPLLLGLAAVIPVTAVLEAPVLGNHWLLAGIVSLAYLLTWGRWDNFEPAARVIFLLFYGFAAFAKINSGFLDPTTSCGVFYANQALTEVGLAGISATSPFGWVASWGPALIEASVPILLINKRTRTWGALLGLSFHGILTLDLAQHFYDFTGVLFPLFVLFLPDFYADRFEVIGARLRPVLKQVLAAVVVVIGVAVTTANVTPLTEFTLRLMSDWSFLWWIPYMSVVLWAAIGSVTDPSLLGWRIGWAGALLALLVVANGLTPYLELKTAYGWNMYSNLVTVDGESNHYVVRATLPLRDGQHDLVTVISSSDPDLQVYADYGYLLPWPSLRYYTASHPDGSLVYRRAGRRVEVSRIGDDPVLSAPAPWWWRWMPYRAINAATPDQCQPSFLPAL